MKQNGRINEIMSEFKNESESKLTVFHLECFQEQDACGLRVIRNQPETETNIRYTPPNYLLL